MLWDKNFCLSPRKKSFGEYIYILVYTYYIVKRYTWTKLKWFTILFKSHLCLYICHPQTVSLYHDSSVGLDRLDSWSWDRNLADWNANKQSTVVEGDKKAPFLIATTLSCRGGRYSFPWINYYITSIYLFNKIHLDVHDENCLVLKCYWEIT